MTSGARPAGAEPPRKRRRIGIHLGTSGGVFRAIERAHAIGANTVQIFSSSPRMWRGSILSPEVCARTVELAKQHDCCPLVVHVSYLVNLASQFEQVRRNSITAFRGEVGRALALGARYLVLHPGSWKGLTRQQGLALLSESMGRAVDGMSWDPDRLEVLAENTAGAEFSLGGTLTGVAEVVDCLRPVVPVAVCFDTCHLHVAGYGLVRPEEYEATVVEMEQTVGLTAVRVWHMNDAKAERGSKLDRHQHVGEGTIGPAVFRRLLHDPRFTHSAFIAETPVDEPSDDERNLAVLLSLAAE